MIPLGEAPPITIVKTYVAGTIINYYTVIPKLDENGRLVYLTSVISRETVFNTMPAQLSSAPPGSYTESLTKRIRELGELEAG